MTFQTLKSKKGIDRLFRKGKRYKSFPVHLLAHPASEGGVQVGVSAPKRVFGRAVDRNKIKRRLRAGVREAMEERELDGHHALMIIYVKREPLVYNVLKEKIALLINRYLQELERSGDKAASHEEQNT